MGQAERPKGAGASKSIRPLADLMLQVSAFASATARQVMFDVNFGFRNQEARKAGSKAAGAATGSVIGRESNALENVDDQI